MLLILVVCKHTTSALHRMSHDVLYARTLSHHCIVTFFTSTSARPVLVNISLTGSVPEDMAVTMGGDLVYTDSNDQSINILKGAEIQPMVMIQELIGLVN